MTKAYDIIKRPIITEQSMEQTEMKRLGAQPAGRRASWKKAIVTLTADSKSIELFEGMV